MDLLKNTTPITVRFSCSKSKKNAAKVAEPSAKPVEPPADETPVKEVPKEPEVVKAPTPEPPKVPTPEPVQE